METNAARLSSPSGKTVVIWNSAAGSTATASSFGEQLRQVPNVRVEEAGSREATLELVKSLCAESDLEWIIAAGGDGTVNSVSSALVELEHRPRLGVLPLGSGNDFARGCGLPLNPLEAWDVVVAGHTRPIDVIEYQSTEGRGWAVNMVTGGNTGRALDALDEEVKAAWGPLAYLRQALDTVGNLADYQLEVQTTQGNWSLKAINLFVANGASSGGGLPVCPTADPGDGWLDVIMIRRGTSSELAGMTKDFFMQDLLTHPLVESCQARELTCHATPPMPLTADGERIGATPLRIRLLPGVIPLAVPSEPTQTATIG